MRLPEWILNLWDEVTPRPPLMPPRKLIIGVGGGDYEAIGREFFRHFTEIGGLQPGHSVLDVGCGCGRMAVPMIPFLSGTGEYHGFDITPAAIAWSQKHISRPYPRFHFELADIHNKNYHPKGRIPSKDYRFPYADASFDFTFLTSVFTHMLADDMERYLSEIARTLKPGGKCMATCFLLNPESRGLIGQGASPLSFKHPMRGGAADDPKNPEWAFAFEEPFLRECFTKYGLTLAEPLRYGKWCGRQEFLSFQDIVLAVKG